jgi:GNAT superfamily N-acetyltransferase
MVEYGVFAPSECPEELFSFRYRIYVEEMHRPQRHADNAAKTIRDPLDATARQVLALKDGRVVGCIRANLLRDGPIGDYDVLYRLDSMRSEERADTSICTRLMVAPEYRRTTIVADIIKHLYRWAIDNRVASSWMDCNPPLVRFFEKFGYERRFQTEHPEYGRVTVMSLDHFDFARLVAIGSPFAETAAAELAKREARALGLRSDGALAAE